MMIKNNNIKQTEKTLRFNKIKLNKKINNK